ncbi:hypothetical protein GOV05_05310 [Candidatus Woesearchaeota archaeon]|nr:hypothetical protein [Candidatus Woesearchaeota archaeon]
MPADIDTYVSKAEYDDAILTMAKRLEVYADGECTINYSILGGSSFVQRFNRVVISLISDLHHTATYFSSGKKMRSLALNAIEYYEDAISHYESVCPVNLSEGLVKKEYLSMMRTLF